MNATTLTDHNGNTWTRNAHGRYTHPEGDANGTDLPDLVTAAGPLIIDGVTVSSPIRARMLASITDPDHYAQTMTAWAAMDHVRATTDRVRYSDLKRGDTIVDDAGDRYRIERVRRTVRGVSGMTDRELTLTGSIRTFTTSASSFGSVNRARD